MKPNLKTFCADCCTCPTVSFKVSTRSKSLEKCGQDSDPFAPPTPPHHIYKKITNCATFLGYLGVKYITTYDADCVPTTEYSCDLACQGELFSSGDGHKYAKVVETYISNFTFNGTSGGTGYMRTTVIVTREYILSPPDPITQYSSCYGIQVTCTGTTSFSFTDGSGTTSGTGTLSTDCTTWTNTVDGVTSDSPEACAETFRGPIPGSEYDADPGNGGPFSVYSEEVTDPGYPLYENEDLTSDLITRVLAALAALSWPTATIGTPVASRSLASDELSFTAEESQYNPSFPLSKVGNGSCFKYTFVARFIPADGSDPVPADDIVIDETWDGTIDPDDSTKGIGTLRTLAVPATDGEYQWGYYTDPTDNTSFVESSTVQGVCVGCV